MDKKSLIEYVFSNLHIFCREKRWIAYFKPKNKIIELECEEAQALMCIQKQLFNGDVIDFAKHKQLVEELLTLLDCTAQDYEFISLQNVNSFYLKFNNSCNLCCEYCNITNNIQQEGTRILAETTALKSIEVMSKLGAKGVGIHGGEPLLHFEQLKKVITGIRKEYPSFYIGLTCNGTLVTDEIATFLQKHNILVSVEIDGGEAEHNKIKKYWNGEESFAHAVHGAEILYKKGILVALEATITAKQKIDHNGIAWLQHKFAGVPITVSRAKGNVADIRACVHHSQALLDFFNEGLSLGLQQKQVFTDAMAHLINLNSSPAISKYICNCILDKVSVDVDGNVYVCPKVMDSNTLIGNIFDKEFCIEFNERREKAASYFDAKKMDLPWYSNLMEICIDSISDGAEKKWHMIDGVELEKYFEDLILMSFGIDINTLSHKWEESGF